MIVGILGLVISMIFWSSWGEVHRRAAYVHGGAVRTAGAPRRRATVIEEEDVAGPPGPPLP